MDSVAPLSMLFGHLGAAANAGMELLTSSDWYSGWAKLVLFGGIPTAIFAIPVYMTAILHGRRRGFRAALVPFAIALLCTVATVVGGRWLADGGQLYGMILYFSWGFLFFLWLPVALVAVWLASWRRRVLIRRYHETEGRRATGETL